MGDEAVVVEDGPGPDRGVGSGAPVHRCVGPDFHIITDQDPAQLGNALVQTIVCAAVVECPAEAALPDPRAGLEMHPIPDQSVGQADTRTDVARAAQNHARANADLGFNHRPGADFCALADAGESADDHALAQLCVFGDARAGIDDGLRRHLRRVEQRRDLPVTAIGVGNRDSGRPCRHQRQRLCRDQHSAGFRGLQRTGVGRIVIEAQVLWRSLGQRCNIAEKQIGVR